MTKGQRIKIRQVANGFEVYPDEWERNNVMAEPAEVADAKLYVFTSLDNLTDWLREHFESTQQKVESTK